MKRVYVAGKYDDKDVVSVLENMRYGMRICTGLLAMGYAPFCPWLDYQFVLMRTDKEKLTKEMFYKYSIAWLEVSDCMLVLDNWHNSGGTKREIEIAKEIKIPIYYSIGELLKSK